MVQHEKCCQKIGILNSIEILQINNSICQIENAMEMLNRLGEAEK